MSSHIIIKKHIIYIIITKYPINSFTLIAYNYALDQSFTGIFVHISFTAKSPASATAATTEKPFQRYMFI